MKIKRKNYKIIYLKLIFLIFFLIILIPILYYCIIIALDYKEEYKINYKTTSDIDYKVYLFKNNYFTEPYLPKGRTYISSLIDYIDIKFYHITNFSDFISGNYTYYIKGTISAQKINDENGNYWTKDYILKDKTTVDFNKQNSIVIEEDVRINYQDYNNLLSEFKKTYGLTFDGYFTVSLVVVSENDSDNLTDSFNINSDCELKIPLTQRVIDLAIDLDNENLTNTVKESKINLKLVNYVFIFISIILLVLLILFLIVIYKSLKKLYFHKSAYAKELRKINATYGNIIVNINNLPDLKDLKTIKVDSFKELIDAHSEVRMPINYFEIEKDYISMFLLLSNNIVWIYVLKNEEYQKKIKEKNK